MCYIFSCFGWALDFLQRILTFIFACILFVVVCFGIVIAIVAGIAYGYNYSMAEFLTFTRQDVTVYMRRGQFYDKPDISMEMDVLARRSGSNDAFGMNKSLDYQDAGKRSNGKDLSDTWDQVQDTRKYAELLTKFSRKPADEPEDAYTAPPVRLKEVPLVTLPPTTSIPTTTTTQVTPIRRIYISPNPMISTTLMQSGNSHIVMRNFQPDTEQPDYRLEQLEEKAFYHEVEPPKRQVFPVAATRARLAPVTQPTVESREKPTINTNIIPGKPIRHWAPTTTKPEYPHPDYRDDIDEDNVVYRPV